MRVLAVMIVTVVIVTVVVRVLVMQMIVHGGLLLLARELGRRGLGHLSAGGRDEDAVLDVE